MPVEIEEQEYARLQQADSRLVAMELDLAKSNFLRENPQVPGKLLDAYQGDPEGVKTFGTALLESFPRPAQPAAPVPAQAAQTPEGQVPNPAAAAAQMPELPVNQQPPQANFQPPPTPEQQAQAYNQQFAQGRPAQTPEQAAAAPGSAAAPVPAPVPGQANDHSSQQQNQLVARSQEIRDKMRIGRATPEEAQWLSQYGEKGFVSAMKAHGAKLRAMGVGQ